MKYNYITIEREYGCGGTQIGREVAKRLGIACCDREIYEMIAGKLGMSVSQVEEKEEKTTNSLLYSLAMLVNVQNGSNNTLTDEQKIHLAMQDEMIKIADAGKSVFIGHCAMEALKDRKGVLKVFIRADDVSKNERIANEYGITANNIGRIREKTDKRRRNTFYANTMKKWESPDNYDLILDSGKLGIENCVSILVGLLS